MGRTVVVTGASSGIGLAAALAFGRRGDDVVLVGRDPDRLRKAAEQVAGVAGRRPLAFRADFAVLDEVRRLAARIAESVERVDVLANNAGALSGWARTTVDGFDPTIQVNHLGGFLLANLLRDKLSAAAPGRLISTGSLAEVWGWLDVDRPAEPLRRYRSRWLAYGASKQANLLFTVEAGRRWAAEGIVATCFFPGLVRSRFGRTSPLFSLARPVLVTPAKAAETLVWLATAPEALVPGGYFAFKSAFPASPRATNPDRAARLWLSSLKAVGLSEH